MPRGRKSTYSIEIADTICERLAQGESLSAICKDAHMPGHTAVFKWLGQHKDFADKYARAREAQADRMADEILEIADDKSRDTIMTEAGERADNEWIQRSRLRVDARKWLASKMAPKKYGDKMDVTHEGEIGVTVQIVRYGDNPDSA